jgi:hypothetical protein
MKRSLFLTLAVAGMFFSAALVFARAAHGHPHERHEFTPDTIPWGPAPPVVQNPPLGPHVTIPAYDHVNDPAALWSAARPRDRVSLLHFVCSKGYTMEKCYEQVAVLRSTLAKYPLAQVGEWTWILVRSEDWKAIVVPRGLDPDSPAFTYSAKRETFIEEALVADVPGRRGELKARWHIRADKLRELVAAHELGHAFCNDRSEAVANQQAERLRDGKTPSCEPNLDAKILADETRKLR